MAHEQANGRPILITGAAGDIGAIGRNVTASLLALTTASLFGKRQLAARRRGSRHASPPQAAPDVLGGATLLAGR